VTVKFAVSFSLKMPTPPDSADSVLKPTFRIEPPPRSKLSALGVRNDSVSTGPVEVHWYCRSICCVMPLTVKSSGRAIDADDEGQQRDVGGGRHARVHHGAGQRGVDEDVVRAREVRTQAGRREVLAGVGEALRLRAARQQGEGGRRDQGTSGERKHGAKLQRANRRQVTRSSQQSCCCAED
jgi:hypothetical protein